MKNNQINQINQVTLAHHRTDFGLVLVEWGNGQPLLRNWLRVETGFAVAPRSDAFPLRLVRSVLTLHLITTGIRDALA